MWSRATFVMAATPPSQAWVASSRPPSPTSMTRDVDASSANHRKSIAVRSSNSVGGPSRRATRSAIGRISPTSRANVAAVDGPAVDLEALAVGDEVRLRRLAGPDAGGPQRGPGERQDAALAVRAAHQGAAQRPLRVAQLAEEGPRPAQPEPDAVAPAIGERLRQPRSYGVAARRPPPVTRGVRSSS